VEVRGSVLARSSHMSRNPLERGAVDGESPVGERWVLGVTRDRE
jgi:hypothetical protein